MASVVDVSSASGSVRDVTDTETPRVSSSVIVSVTACGSATDAPEAAPDTVTLAFAASTALSTAVSVTVPVLAVAPFAIVSVLFADTVTGDPFGTLTVTVTSCQVAADRLAVTVDTVSLAVELLSLIDVGVSTSSAVGVASSSVIVPLPEPAPPLRPQPSRWSACPA